MNGLHTSFTKSAPARPNPRISVRIAFIIGALLLAACDDATPVPSPTPQPINTVAPAIEPTVASGEAVATTTVETAAEATDAATEVPAATEAAAATDAATEVPVATEVAATQAPPTAVPNETGVSLTVPPSLAQSYEAQIETAIPVGEGPAFGGASPEHVLIAFDQETIQFSGNPRERQIRVYPVSGLRAIDPFFGEEIDKLQAMLKTKPAVYNDNITALPVVNAAQVFHTQMKYLDFANGTGVRFLSAYAQDITPITNENIFYTFQGLTSDGQYYISAFYPISSTALPNTYADSTAAQNLDEFAKDYTSKYLPGIAEGLNSLPPDQFVPDLSELDTLVQSLSAAPVLPTSAVSTTAIITSTGVETSTEVTPSISVTEAIISGTAITTDTTAPATVMTDTATMEPAATFTPTAILTTTAVETATVAVSDTVSATALATASATALATASAPASAPITATVAVTEASAPIATGSATVTALLTGTLVPTATAVPIATGVTTEAVTSTVAGTATPPPGATAAAAALQPAGEGTILRLVNVRSLPSTAARVLTQLTRNTKVQVLARSPRSNWFYVQLADGTRGWVAQSFLRMNVTVRSLPVLS